MKSTAIIELMVRDHGKLVKHLNLVEQALDENTVEKMKVFDEFSWLVDKHLFTEEKALFVFYDPDNVTAGYKMVPQLIQEHNDITNRLRVMRRNLLQKNPVDFNGMKILLMKHKMFEEEHVYPQLDQELTDQQKNMIINRIQEMV